MSKSRVVKMKKEQESAEKQKKKCCPKWLKIVGIIVIALILAFGIPILINESYKANCGYVTMWSAADMLAFYGTILAAILAGIGVYISIWYSNKNYREDVRVSALPFIALTVLERKATVNASKLFREQVAKKSAPENTESKPAVEYKEWKSEQIYFVIYSDGIKAQQKLNKDQQEILDTVGNVLSVKPDGTYKQERSDYCSIPLEIENVGNGTAVNFCADFNYADEEESHSLSTPMTLKQNQTVYIHIFSTEKPEKLHGEYVLKFFYEDLYGNRYVQQFPVIFRKNENGQEIKSIRLSGEQKRI